MSEDIISGPPLLSHQSQLRCEPARALLPQALKLTVLVRWPREAGSADSAPTPRSQMRAWAGWLAVRDHAESPAGHGGASAGEPVWLGPGCGAPGRRESPGIAELRCASHQLEPV